MLQKVQTVPKRAFQSKNPGQSSVKSGILLKALSVSESNSLAVSICTYLLLDSFYTCTSYGLCMKCHFPAFVVGAEGSMVRGSLGNFMVQWASLF